MKLFLNVLTFHGEHSISQVHMIFWDFLYWLKKSNIHHGTPSSSPVTNLDGVLTCNISIKEYISTTYLDIFSIPILVFCLSCTSLGWFWNIDVHLYSSSKSNTIFRRWCIVFVSSLWFFWHPSFIGVG